MNYGRRERKIEGGGQSEAVFIHVLAVEKRSQAKGVFSNSKGV